MQSVHIAWQNEHSTIAFPDCKSARCDFCGCVKVCSCTTLISHAFLMLCRLFAFLCPFVCPLSQISQKTIIDMAADRGIFIDQSQSLNIHMSAVTSGKLTSMHFHAWKKGLKTGMYYLRTKPAVDAIKFTVDPVLIKQQQEESEAFKLMQGQQSRSSSSSARSAIISGPSAFQSATAGMHKLAVGSPVKQAPNPRGEVATGASSSTFSMAHIPMSEKTAEQARAERAEKEAEIRKWEESQEQGSCKGGMCSA